MGVAVSFEGVNRRFTAPEGRDDVATLEAFSNGACVVTAWKLTAAEIEDINRTGKTFVSQFYGGGLVPHFVGSSESVRELCIDYGGCFPRQKDQSA